MHLHCWKGRLKIWKLTKFKGDTLKASEDIVSQSRREIFLTFVWWGGGGGPNLPPSYKRAFAELYDRQITFKLSIFTNCGGGGGCVLEVLMDFRQSKVEKAVEESIWS